MAASVVAGDAVGGPGSAAGEEWDLAETPRYRGEGLEERLNVPHRPRLAVERWN